MPDSAMVYVVAAVALIFVSGLCWVIGYAQGIHEGTADGYERGRKSRDHEWQQGREQLMLSATKAGVASYVLNETTGKVEFQWKEVKKNA